MRPDRHSYFLDIAHVVSKRSTCVRRAVGCVLVDVNGNISATGYNGVPRGQAHCNEGNPCPGSEAPAGSGLDECYAIHAEQNALLQCRDVNSLLAIYCTASPCIHCMKMLLNTSARLVVYREPYAHQGALELWVRSGRQSLLIPQGMSVTTLRGGVSA